MIAAFIRHGVKRGQFQQLPHHAIRAGHMSSIWRSHIESQADLAREQVERYRFK